MYRAHVLIDGKALEPEQVEVLHIATEVLFNRTERFLTDCLHWKEEEVKRYVDQYLLCAGILRNLNSNWESSKLNFVGNKAYLNGTVEEVFGRRKSRKGE